MAQAHGVRWRRGLPGRARARAVRPWPADGARPRVVVFHAEGFPDGDAPGFTRALLGEALAGLPAAFAATLAELRRRLEDGAEVLVLAHGSAFPLGAWEAIRAHLERGGGLVVLGGAPFHQPVLGDAGRWRRGARQPTFARELLIGPAEELATAGLEPPRPAEGSGWTGTLAHPARTFALTVRLATAPDHPLEAGSSGPREAVLTPLLHLGGPDGLPRACPLLELDHFGGPFGGGRWVLAPHDAPMDAAQVRACVLRALAGPSRLEVRPINAALLPGEPPRFRVTLLRGGPWPGQVQATLADAEGRQVAAGGARLDGTDEAKVGELVLAQDRALAPGLYHLEAWIAGTAWKAACGVWVRDEQLLQSGSPFGAGRDWLTLDGRPCPVLGTTYMASDVHRKFLFEPDPARWDRDFARMAALGVNFVRTGLWTAWDRLMLDAGAPDDTALRALDAFVLTAASHGLQVCFTFFAFLPVAFGGLNPYLDPQALAGQKLLLATVARRFRGCPWVHYDLINEPSYAPADALWTSRPLGDPCEARAWRAWAAAHLGTDPADLRDPWRDGSTDPWAVPSLEDLAPAPIKNGRRPRKALAFRRFTQEVVARWAGALREALREAGGEALVTVGQDEAGLAASPSQQTLAAVLDYATVHSWWLNDDLLWDGLCAKVPEQPMLVQETGLMRLEDLDGQPWRSPEQAARLLERKFALAFAARGCGAVQWAWDINPYQPVDNEAVIGFFRPDGTAKEELRVLAPFRAFLDRAAPYLEDYAPDPLVLVLPRARLFLEGAPGGAGTRRLVRVLAERFGLAPTCLADDLLSAERLGSARLILVPDPGLLEEAAAEALLAAAAAGAKILVTGAVTGDAAGGHPPALARLGLVDAGRPLEHHEPTRWGGWATFPGDLAERRRRSLAEDLATLTGPVWHEPLPLELAEEEGPLVRLLEAALAAAGLAAAGGGTPVTSRVLELPRAWLAVCVNETPLDLIREVRAGGRVYRIPVAAGRSRLVLIAREGGAILAETPGPPTEAAADLMDPQQSH